MKVAFTVREHRLRLHAAMMSASLSWWLPLVTNMKRLSGRKKNFAQELSDTDVARQFIEES